MGALLVGLIAVSCTARVPPIDAGRTPFTPSPVERRLWSEAEREEESLLTRATIYEDPRLDEYLGRVAAKLTPGDVGPDGPVIKLVVLRDPTLAAFAMPEGRVFLHTGLLSRLENEAHKLYTVAQSGDEAAVKAQIGAVGKSCGGCHESFRQKQ